MSVTTIGSILTSKIIPGSGNYASTLSIAPAGGISLAAGTALGIYGSRMVTNAGIITGGVAMSGDGLLLNEGTILAAPGVTLGFGATLINDGTLEGPLRTQGIGGPFFSSFTNNGVFTGSLSAIYAVVTNTGTLNAASAVSISVLSTLNNSGTITGGGSGVSLSESPPPPIAARSMPPATASRWPRPA